MALQIPENQRPMVVAPYKDTHGFSQGYQEKLRERIIGAHLGHILGPIQAIDTVPMARSDVARRAAVTRSHIPSGPIKTHVAPDLITCDQLKFRPDLKAKFEES